MSETTNMTVTHKIAHALMMLSAVCLFADHERAEFNKLVGEIRDFDPDAPDDTETLNFGEKPYSNAETVDDAATFSGSGASIQEVRLNPDDATITEDSRRTAVSGGQDTGAGVNIETSDGQPIGDQQTITYSDVGSLDDVLNETGDENKPLTGVQDGTDATITEDTVDE